MELMPEPTADVELEPAAMNEPVKRAEPTIAPEPELGVRSDQVRELATHEFQWPCLQNTRGWKEAPPIHPPLRVS